MNLDQKIYFLYKAMMAAFKENGTSREDMDSIEDVFDEASKLLRKKYCHNSKQLYLIELCNDDYEIGLTCHNVAKDLEDARRQAKNAFPAYDPDAYLVDFVSEVDTYGKVTKYRIILSEIKDSKNE